ncbi:MULTISPECIES: hypothetical protein [Bradyrhizobium]|nr:MULTISPECIES: hypothetical protein [Bradyrhizobium]OCX32685.1 hypothetical protein QU42_02775 [Bradyrhizobium sp. UASWS1016]
MQIDVEMNLTTLPFDAWRRNVYSQCGEDGIIEQLIEMTGLSQRYFVEFGAWDGRHLSNCAKLADEGWSGCFIEGDKERWLVLNENYADRPNIVRVNTFVGSEGNALLDNVLEQVNAPADPGVLSIDIDGTDYHVWAALKRYRPTIVVVEFNPSIPAPVLFVQDNDASVKMGSSLSAFTHLAAEKGYCLVATTDWNAFFVPRDLCISKGIQVYQPSQVKKRDYEAYLFHGYDGTMIVAGHRQLIWHSVEYGPTELQLVPAELRRFPLGHPDEYYRLLQAFRDRSRKDD